MTARPVWWAQARAKQGNAKLCDCGCLVTAEYTLDCRGDILGICDRVKGADRGQG